MLTPAWLGVNSLRNDGDWSGFTIGDRGALPASTFGTVRWWDDPTVWSTRWCDMQPNPSADVEANLSARLDPKLDKAAAQRVTRIVMTIGHAAPWVFDKDGTNPAANTWDSHAPHTPVNTDGGLWFCGAERSAMSMPSAAYLGSASSPGPGWLRWRAYTRTLLNHIQAWSDRRAGMSGSTLPFTIIFQTFNEPTWMLRADGGVPNAATTAADAARSLAVHDVILRAQMDSLPGLDRARLRLQISPITKVSGENLYLKQAEAWQPTSFTHYRGLYDEVAVHHYSMQSKVSPTPAETLATAYDSKFAPMIAAFRGSSTGTAPLFPRLGRLPIVQTETNQGLAAVPESRANNAYENYTAADRRMLVSRMLVSALRWNLAGNLLYSLNGSSGQYTADFDAGPRGAMITHDTVVDTFLTVRSWMIGQTFSGCTVSSGRVDCWMWDSQVRPSRIVWMDSGSGAFTVPWPARVERPDGTVVATEVAMGTRYPVGALPLRFTRAD